MYGDAVAPRCLRLLLAQAAAVHGDEAGAEAVHAGEVLVAGRLVDGALAAELGFHRHHRDAVGLHRAVAAALADQLVDEDAFGRIGIASALTAARSEEHTSELQSLMRISYAVFCLKKKNRTKNNK